MWDGLRTTTAYFNDCIMACKREHSFCIINMIQRHKQYVVEKYHQPEVDYWESYCD